MGTAIFDCFIRSCDFFDSFIRTYCGPNVIPAIITSLKLFNIMLFSIMCVVKEILLYYWLDPQQDSGQAVGGMRHVGFRGLLVLSHCLCYKNDVILYD